MKSVIMYCSPLLKSDRINVHFLAYRTAARHAFEDWYRAVGIKPSQLALPWAANDAAALTPRSVSILGQTTGALSAMVHSCAKQGALYTSSCSMGGGCCPKIISQDRSSRLGFIVSGRPNRSVKKSCVGIWAAQNSPCQPATLETKCMHQSSISG